MRIVFVIVVCFIAGSIAAQISPSVSMLYRYGNGRQNFGGISSNLLYRELIADSRLSLPQNFNVGFRFLYDSPPELGQKFSGIKRRYIEYLGDDFQVRIGNFSEIYGKGLALNLFENRGLAYDTWADGLKASYQICGLDASLISGKVVFADSINYWREETYNVSGTNLEYDFDKNLSAGLSYLSTEGELPQRFNSYSTMSEVSELYGQFNFAGFEFFLNYAYKWTNIKNVETSFGEAVYSTLTYSQEGFGAILEYKNYRFDERDPYQRYDGERPSRMLPIQNPPITKKEHSFLFLSRSISEIDFNDEVGFQTEFFFTHNDTWFFNLNASASSRHNFFTLKPNGFEFARQKRSANYLPSFDKKYSPLYEVFLQAEYSLDYYSKIEFGIARRKSILYNDFFPANSHEITSSVIPMLLQYVFSRDYSLSVQYELELVNDNYNTPQPNYNNNFISVTGNLFSKFNLNFRYERTTNRRDLSGKKDWFTFEAGWRITDANTIQFSVGRERGGQTCSNGVCRYIQPFEGFRMQLLSYIN